MHRHVRAARTDDLDAIVGFQQAMAAETEDKALDGTVVAEGVRRLLDMPGAGFYLVAEVDDRVVGSLMVTHEWSDWRNGWFWWVQSVYVTAPYRRRGIYRALYEAVKVRATDAPDVRGFRLYVERENRNARSTYEALGMFETAYRLYEQGAEA